MDHREIELTQGYKAIVSVEDYEVLSQYKWHALKDERRVYASAWIDGRNVAMHRLLLGSEAGKLDIDHRNHNALDNRRENLRVATRSQNTANSRKQAGTTSKYKGVHVCKRGYIKAYICYLYKRIHLGYFATEEAAARAYDAAALKYFGEYAAVNFPEPIAA